jgi:hypothetical protein
VSPADWATLSTVVLDLSVEELTRLHTLWEKRVRLWRVPLERVSTL